MGKEKEKDIEMYFPGIMGKQKEREGHMRRSLSVDIPIAPNQKFRMLVFFFFVRVKARRHRMLVFNVGVIRGDNCQPLTVMEIRCEPRD
jgi:hypothetical protein